MIADIEAGAEPLTLKGAARLKCMKRDGANRSAPFMHRICSPTKSHPLDVAVINGVRMTTEAACLRWLAANSSAAPSARRGWTPGRTCTLHQEASRQLDAAGL